MTVVFVTPYPLLLARGVRFLLLRFDGENSLVVCDESGHMIFPFSLVVLSWGELG